MYGTCIAIAFFVLKQSLQMLDILYNMKRNNNRREENVPILPEIRGLHIFQGLEKLKGPVRRKTALELPHSYAEVETPEPTLLSD
ncbi:unnamed protein product [Nezara viridula]|uniref:Uncharacterized protein n=1 Tax=Nezara viridula TaxID=85310 RepID=A0A9P0HC37_NEZVI|nr:unnamed protein product [Nezara viridula]